MKEIKFPPITKPLKGSPILKKNGIIYPNGAEMSVFVRNGKFLGLNNHWGGYNGSEYSCATIVDYFTCERGEPFGKENCRFYQAFCEGGDRVYVYATEKNKVHQFVSDDLIHWEESIAFEFPEIFECFNTSVCKGENGYVMAIECGGAKDGDYPDLKDPENPYIGERFTEFFATSPDLVNWKLMPFENGYTKDRYNACPALKYCEGYYYMICLESLPCWRWAPYIYRTKDFETWEVGFYNPMFIPSREDLTVKEGYTVPESKLNMMLMNLTTNNSDVDLCEFEGKTYIVYATGNQGRTSGSCVAEITYDGPLDEFLKANFE